MSRMSADKGSEMNVIRSENLEPLERRKRAVAVLSLLVIGLTATIPVFMRSNAIAAESENKKDAAASRVAFLEVYKVLMHSRCMNCHPNGDQPLQGEDSHVHTMNVKRGDTGTGEYALKCGNCH